MIIRRGLLVFQLLLVWVVAQNEQQEGSGNLADQEGSGQMEMPETETSDTSFQQFETSDSFYEYLNSGFGFDYSIKEAPSSSDSWVVEKTPYGNDMLNSNENVVITADTDNDIIFVDEENKVQNQNTLNGDDEDYVAEISGNNALEEFEEDTNAILSLGGDQSNIRTIEKVSIENEIEVITVIPIIPNANGNALGNTGDGKAKLSPVLSKYGGLSAMLLLGAAVGVGALLSLIGFLACKARSCNQVKHNVSVSRYPA